MTYEIAGLIVGWLFILAMVPLALLRAARRREARAIAQGLTDLENFANQQGASR